MIYLKTFFLTFIASFIFAQISYSEFDVEARYVILQDHLSGDILYEKEADARIYPASMTKIMTSIITFDLIKRGELSLDDKITIYE